MNKRRLAINIIYSIILIMVTIISFFVIKKTQEETDLIEPILEASVDGSIISLHATDNIGVHAYTYNKIGNVPDNWYEANNKEEFDTTLRVQSEGIYYIWVKDKADNISKTISVNLKCESGSFKNYDNKVICPYSKLYSFGYNWHVLEDRGGYITLFMDSGELAPLNHCDTLQTSEYCYYVSNEEYDSYSWNKSIINHYLNTDFLSKFSNVELKEEKICSDRSGQRGCIDGDGCGGYLASDINELGYFCRNQFTPSKVRLITIVEYSKILSDLENEDKTWVYGNDTFWTMNSWREPIYASSISSNGSFNVDEDTTQKLGIRPIIVVKK